MLEFFELITSIIKQYEGNVAYAMVIVASILYGIRYIVKNYSFSLRDYLEHSLNEKDKKHKEALKHRKNIMPVIRDEITKLAQEIGADRVLICEFSNGNSNVVGLPFLYMTATNEVTTPSTPTVAHSFQRINTCMFADFLELLEDKTYVYIENLEEVRHIFPTLYNMLNPNGTKTVLFYSLYGVSGPIGFLSASTISNRNFTKDVGLPRIAQVAQKISTLLNFNEWHERL